MTLGASWFSETGYRGSGNELVGCDWRALLSGGDVIVGDMGL